MPRKTQRTELVPLDRLLPMSKVIDLTSLSKATVYRKVAEGTFPAPLRIGTSRVAWSESDIAQWIKTRTRTVDPGLQALSRI
jgi:prophage regulatory protein